MKYSVRTFAAGIGVAGLLGTGAIADTQNYQNPTGQATSPAAESGPSQGEMNQPKQTGPSQQMSGSRETAKTIQAEQKGEHQRQGTIRSINPDSKILVLKGLRMHRDFAWSDSTQVLRNGKPVSALDLKKGERVNVTFRKEGGKLVAEQIVIQERQQAKASKRSHRGY